VATLVAALLSLGAGTAIAQPAAAGTAASATPESGARPAPLAGAPATREQVERRITSTQALLEKSSGARQIESSGNPDARVQWIKAQELLAAARGQFGEGQLDASNKLLHAAAKTMMEAVVLSSIEQVTAVKERRDFDARMESTRALLDAQKRITTEKGAGPRNAELVQRIEGLLAEAGRQAAAGRVGDGRKLLDQAYGAARASIGGLRGGDTLVRSLNFASKEEEYHYEIDRNDTHRMLVTVLLQDRRSAALDAAVDKSLAESGRLRQQAEGEAARKEHEAAIKTLEASTRELVKAIRSAGVYIPG
jgi:hypothetical protein